MSLMIAIVKWFKRFCHQAKNEIKIACFSLTDITVTDDFLYRCMSLLSYTLYNNTSYLLLHMRNLWLVKLVQAQTVTTTKALDIPPRAVKAAHCFWVVFVPDFGIGVSYIFAR